MHLRNYEYKIKANINYLFYIGFFLYTFLNICSQSMLGQGSIILRNARYINIFYFLIIVLKIYFEGKFSLREFMGLVGIVLICISIYIFTNATYPVTVFLFILGSSGCSPKRIVQIHMYTYLAVVLLSMLAAYTGAVEDRVFYALSGSEKVVRHSMGMTYVTIWSGTITNIAIDWLYLLNKKQSIKWFHLLFIFLIALYVYKMSAARVDFVIFIMIIVFTLFYKKFEKSKTIKYIYIYAIAICCFISFGITYMYMSNPTKYAGLNEMLSGRLLYASQGIKKYGIPIFGKIFRMQGFGTVDFDKSFGYFFIDSFYVNKTLLYGVAFMIIIIMFSIYISRKLYNQKKFFLLLLLMLNGIRGIIISSIIFPMFIVGYLESREDETCKNEDRESEDEQINRYYYVSQRI